MLFLSRPMVDFILNDPPGNVGQLGPCADVAEGYLCGAYPRGRFVRQEPALCAAALGAFASFALLQDLFCCVASGFSKCAGAAMLPTTGK